MAEALEIRELKKSYSLGETPLEVLKGVALEVPPGQVCAVMGPSGVGKSTLLSCIAGLEAPDEGVLRVLGHDLREMDDTDRTLLRRRKLGIIYQFFNLVSNLDARENVALPFLIDGRPPDDARVDGALERVGMTKRRHHFPTQLSGGEMQLVSIARALVLEPKLILADEPTGNVNVETGRRIMSLLSEVAHENGCALILVTHNPEDAARTDRVVFMRDGALAADAELNDSEVCVAAIHERLRTLGI